MRVSRIAPLAGGLLCWAGAAQGALVISEYVEGSSFNKALELYNSGTDTLDLSQYSLDLYSNGSSSATGTLTLTGTLAAGETLVLAHGSAATDILMLDPVIDNSVINHNGDDAYVLRRGVEVVDRFGRVGERPAEGYWGTADDNTKDHTLRRKLSILVGDADFSGVFDPAVEWDFFASNTFGGLGRHGEDDTPEEPLPGTIGACGDPATLISAVQGSADVSPLAGAVHEVEAVVTVVYPGLEGYFLMEEVADQDMDPATSEGLFIYQPGFTVAAGQQVRVRGPVSEYFGQTQISAQDVVVCASDMSVPAVTFSLPLENPEALESMLVQVPAGLTVTEVYDLGRYGSVVLSEGRLPVPTHVAAPGEGAMAQQQYNDRHRIILDDASNQQNPGTVIYPQAGLAADNTLRVGDQAGAFTAVLSYGFDAWRLQPVSEVTFEATNARPAAPARHPEANLRVAAFNVLNFFNGDGQGGGFPTARGARNAEELARQRDKLVAALTALNADVIGLMEIENDGYGSASAIAELASAMGASWRYVDPGTATLGTDVIAVGLLYRSDVVEQAGTAAALTDEAFAQLNRVPLAQAFRLVNGDEAVVVAVNHLKSKGSCDEATGADMDQSDGAGCWNPTREAAATALLGEQGARTMIVGDLNAYAKEGPVTLLENAGYENLLARFHGDEVYSYVFFGQSGYLDHVLASAALQQHVVGAGAWHINADEPRALEYTTQYKSEAQIAAFYAPDAYRSSDHDPVYADLRLVAGEGGETPAEPGDDDDDGGAVGLMLGLAMTLLGWRRRARRV